MSPLNCWAVLLQQTRQQSRESATLGEVLAGPLAQRLSHIAEDVGRLVKKVRPLPWAQEVRVAPGSAGGGGGWGVARGCVRWSSEDPHARPLHPQSKDLEQQLQEELLEVVSELQTVSPGPREAGGGASRRGSRKRVRGPAGSWLWGTASTAPCPRSWAQGGGAKCLHGMG